MSNNNRVCPAWFFKGLFIFALLAIFPRYVHAVEQNMSTVSLAPPHASGEVQQIFQDILSSGDNKNMPFIILDKKQAQIYSFQKDGQLLGEAPALLGIAIGDYYYPGTGQKQMSEIKVEERTTPAGRFHALLGYNSHGEEVLWVDFDMAIAIHIVVKGTVRDRRLERLQSPNPKDHRISFGCVNVPAPFYTNTISPYFVGTGGMVYVLPDTKKLSEVFGDALCKSTKNTLETSSSR